MQKYGLLIVAAALASLALGCGGGPKTRPVAGSGGGRVVETEIDDDGRPGWIMRGSTAIRHDQKRIFFGVGVADSIKNVALLRTTADNRARNSLAQIFETFSASLMKDYMASNNGVETQQVEQAIKTFTSMSLKGSEIIDRYIGQDGTMYALAALDLGTVRAVSEAQEAGAFTSYVKEVSVDDVFDRHSKGEPARERAPAMATAETPREAPQQSHDEARPSDDDRQRAKRSKGGKAPDWVSGEDLSFPWERYLCGVGVGPNRVASEDAAFAALSRIFYAKVRSVSRDFMGAYSKTGAESLEVQETETTTMVSTGKVFSGVELKEVWEQDSKTIYALACLEREPAARRLRDQMADADSRIGDHLSGASTSDKRKKVAELTKALRALLEYQALNAELRIVSVDGYGRASDYSHADIVAALSKAVDALRIGVVVRGPYESDFKTALQEGLTRRGYKIEADASTGVDVHISAEIEIEEAGERDLKGRNRTTRTFYARSVVLLEVKSTTDSKVLGSFTQTGKGGGSSKRAAERQSVMATSKKLIKDVSKKVEEAMLR